MSIYLVSAIRPRFRSFGGLEDSLFFSASQMFKILFLCLARNILLDWANFLDDGSSDSSQMTNATPYSWRQVLANSPSNRQQYNFHWYAENCKYSIN